MSLSYSSQIVAEVAVVHISGCKGIGNYQLRFSFLFQVPSWPEVQEIPTRCSNLRARVLVARPGSNPQVLGWAIPEAVVTLMPLAHGTETRLLFDLDLSSEQLHSIEDLRSGGELHFEIRVSGDAIGPIGILSVYDVIQKRMNQSEWSGVLRDLGHSEILVAGIELPNVPSQSALSGVVQSIRRAYDSLHQGQYDVSVAQCRHAMDALYALDDIQKLAADSAEKFKSKKQSMSKLDRERFMGEAVRHYTHLAHHIDEEGQMASFSRADATTTLALTIAAVSNAVRREKILSLAPQGAQTQEHALDTSAVASAT